MFRYSTIGYWTGGICWEWYIPSITMLYLLAPFLKQLFEHQHQVLLCCITISILIFVFLFIDKNLFDRAHFFFIYRIPAFIFGMACAFWLKNNNSHNYYTYLLIAGIPIFAILYPQHHQIYNYKNFSLLFLLPTNILIFILLTKVTKIINSIISMIGKSSLEIYLIQQMFYSHINNNASEKLESTVLYDLRTVTLIVMCSCLGIAVHWTIEKICKKKHLLSRKKCRE